MRLPLYLHKRFVKKVVGYSVPMYWHKNTNDNWAAWVNTSRIKDKSIYLAESFREYSITEQRVMLLHECGHLSTKIDYKSIVKSEFNADKWAINRASELGLEEELKILKEWVGIWSRNKSSWNTSHRRYILAARMTQEHGVT